MERELCAFLILVLPFSTALAGDGVVRDRGLHREWKVEISAAHPERPALLVEVPWKDAEPASARRDPAGTGTTGPLLVRPGMRVTLVGSGAALSMHLSGTALAGGHDGETIPVRGAFRGTLLRGIVRGPGLLQILPGQGK